MREIQSNTPREGRSFALRIGYRVPIAIGAATYIILGLATIGHFHDPNVVGISYLVLGLCHYLGNR